MRIRKLITVVEDLFRGGGKDAARPVRKVAALAVIQNPFADTFQEDLSPLVDWGEELGRVLGERAVAALGPGKRVESYGKAAIVGERGEAEHAAALLHPKLGNPLRQIVGGGKTLIPSVKKMGRLGDSLDIPLHYKDAAFVRSHFDGMTVSVSDAPKGDEILVAVALTDGPRPYPRVGGLKKEEARGEDGLR